MQIVIPMEHRPFFRRHVLDYLAGAADSLSASALECRDNDALLTDVEAEKDKVAAVAELLPMKEALSADTALLGDLIGVAAEAEAEALHAAIEAGETAPDIHRRVGWLSEVRRELAGSPQ